MSAPILNVELNDGTLMPCVGFGTFQMPPTETEALASQALAAGYPMIDTARFYGNEEEVGAAVRSHDGYVFVTTKLWRSDMGYDQALAGFDASFAALGLDAIDLFLIHWPEPQTGLYVDTWKALVRLKEEGRAKAIGVSNFRETHLRDVIDATGEVPAVNQVECHPRFQQQPLKRFCVEQGIAVTAWSPLGRALALDEPTIVGIAERHHRTPAQVILRWHLQEKVIVIPKASSRARMAENIDLFGFELDDDDMAAMAALDDPDGRIGPDPDDTPNFKGLPPAREAR